MIRVPSKLGGLPCESKGVELAGLHTTPTTVLVQEVRIRTHTHVLSATTEIMDDPVVASLSREAALELARSNGTILCLDVPAQIEFGIDLRSYTVGPRFRGIKMIPTNGLHLVTWGSEMHVCATFVELSASDVSVLRWDAREEALCQVQEVDELQRLVHEVRDMRHDAALGPYPLATQEHWSELSKYISADVLRRAEIPCGVVVEPGGIDAAELEAELERAAAATAAASASSDNTRAAAPPAPRAAAGGAASAASARVPTASQAGDVAARAAQFVSLDVRRSGTGRLGAALSTFHLDRSAWLSELLACHYASGRTEEEPRTSAAAAEEALLGELQLAYILFLRLSSLRALEQWKALLHLLCGCDAALRERPQLYCNLAAVLRAQLAFAPDDLFVGGGELGAENFLRASLATLAENSTEGARLAPALSEGLRRLWDFVGERFGLSLQTLLSDAGGGEEDQPVYVSVEEA